MADSSPVTDDTPPLRRFPLNDFELQSGVCVDLELAYRCYGELNADKNNVILLPTFYTGKDLSYRPIIGPEFALNPQKYFIIIPNLFGNGVSSSPSNMAPPLDGPRFPSISIFDNVRAQSLLLDSLVGVGSRIELVLGWSMGGLQTYQWAAQYPKRIRKALILCGTAKTSQHNQVFLHGVKSCIEADHVFEKGHYSSPPVQGLRAFARVYVGWAYSQSFFRKRRYLELGFDNPEELMMSWERDHLEWDANDLLAMLDTWVTADISEQPAYGGSLEQALAGIEAKVWLAPCEQDLYFRYEDNLEELKHLRDGEYHGFVSDFGHVAPGPGRFPKETVLIEDIIRSLLLSKAS